MATTGWDDSEHFKEHVPISGVLPFPTHSGVSSYLRCYPSILYDLEPNIILAVNHLLYLVSEVGGINDP